MNRLALILFFLIGTMMSCKTEQKAVAQTKITQGIAGKVIWKEGDFMPTINGSNKNKTMPVSREIHIYEVAKVNQGKREKEFYTSVDTKLVKTVTADKDGNFIVFLEPGKYSLFTKEEGGLYANLTDGENIWPVTVDAGKISEISFVIDYKATY